MIAYMPNLYPDELAYSWCSRYYAHSGYPSYSMALEDLFNDKNYRLNYEFTGHFNVEAVQIIGKVTSIGEIVEQHTMYPYYARFATPERRTAAYEALTSGKHIGKLLPIPTSDMDRFLMYCPLCAKNDRMTYGEAYLHRTHQIRHIGICPKHGCKLHSTGIRIYANASPRLFVPEEIIPQEPVPEQVQDPSELELAGYISEVFSQPIRNMAPIGAYLTHRLRGTPYISTIGTMRQVAKLHHDMTERYADFEYREHHIQKVLLGYCHDPHLIILMAHHLGITPHDLCSCSIPETACITHTHTRARSSYSTRKGAQVQDWERMDKVSLPRVRSIIKTLHMDSTGRPRRVTKRAVCDTMGWPSKRLDLLPLCKAEVNRYHETMQQYWAREIVWAYNKLQDNKAKLNWKAIRNLTNIRRCDFLAAQPLLYHYIDSENCTKIRNL